MEQRETVYKLYKDASKTIKNTMYLRPLCMGIGMGAGTLISYVINSDNKVLFGVCAGVEGSVCVRRCCTEYCGGSYGFRYGNGGGKGAG